jgi:hypothetical protein
MSIATTIGGLEQANAVHKAANGVPVAKRGMFAMIEREHAGNDARRKADVSGVGAVQQAGVAVLTAPASSRK